MGHHLLQQSMSFSVQGITILDLNTLSPNSRGFPGGSDSKESACSEGELGIHPWAGTIQWRRKWQPTPVILPGESRGQRSLAGYSPCSHKESNTTEWLTLSLSLNSTCSFGLWRSIWLLPWSSAFLHSTSVDKLTLPIASTPLSFLEHSLKDILGLTNELTTQN